MAISHAAAGTAWAQDAADRMLRAIGTAEAIPGSGVPANRLAPAVAAAHRELDNVAARRGRELSIEADAERGAEIARATEYYAAALAAIDNRRGGAHVHEINHGDRSIGCREGGDHRSKRSRT